MLSYSMKLMRSLLLLPLLIPIAAIGQEANIFQTQINVFNNTLKSSSQGQSKTKLQHQMNSGYNDIEVLISSYVDNYSLTGWIQTSPDCQTENNICQEINIDSLLIQMIIKGTFNREENGRYYYRSLSFDGHIKFHGQAERHWPTTNHEIFRFEKTIGYQYSDDQGEIEYSKIADRVTHINMYLPYDDYPRIYRLIHSFGNGIDTLAIRAKLSSGWAFTYPYDLYQVYPAHVTGEDCSDLNASFTFQHEPISPPGEPAQFWRFVFSNTSSGQPQGYKWDFGDGTTSTLRNPIHVYPDGCDQEYEVKLRITKGYSCSDFSVEKIRTNPSTSCPKPIALIAHASGAPPATDLISVAADHLESSGWKVEVLSDADIVHVATWLKNPCVRGFYFIAHGGRFPDKTPGFNFGEGKQLKSYRPAQLGAITLGRQFDFVTVIVCLQTRQAWQSAFNVKETGLVLPKFSIFGVSAISPERDAARIWKYGINYDACNGNKQLFISPNKSSYLSESAQSSVLPGSLCLPLFICNSTMCGTDLYPVHTCATSFGVATDGVFTVSPVDSMFRVDAYVPATYEDSIACSAIYYKNVPEELVYKNANPINRFLFFADVIADTAVVADSLEITMRYLQSDVESSDEKNLGVYWMTDDSLGFKFIDSEIDTAANVISFTVSRWGIAGIYDMSTMTSIPDNSKESAAVSDFGIKQNYPNPFNATTSIEYKLLRDSEVELSVFDVDGNTVKVLIKGHQFAGSYKILWDGKNDKGGNVASGTYFYKLKSSFFFQTRKMVLLR